MEVSNEEKNDLINKIVISMWDEIGEQAAKRLQAALYVNLSGYDVRKISTELTVYDEKNAADYLKKFLIAKKIKGCTDRTLHFYGTSLKKIFETISKSPMDIQADDIRMPFLLQRSGADRGKQSYRQRNHRKHYQEAGEIC